MTLGLSKLTVQLAHGIAEPWMEGLGHGGPADHQDGAQAR